MSKELARVGRDDKSGSGNPKIDADREAIIGTIIFAVDQESWAQDPMTKLFLDGLTKHREALEESVHADLDAADKPLSSADQARYWGERAAYRTIEGQIKDAARAVTTAIEKAREFEDKLSTELQMHYKPPAWGEDWLGEATRRADAGGGRKRAAS